MSGRARVAVGIGAVALALGFAACGDEDQVRYGDAAIIERLNLDRNQGGYAIGADPFCEVAKNLLNDADEVEEAADHEELGLVISSAAGNVGVQGVAPFAPDCRNKARKKLKKLDPKPKED